MNAEVRNPFRIPKPKKDILYKGTFFPATDKGKHTGDSFVRIPALLTPHYLWLGEELSIPLASIRSVELLDKGRAVQITYRHWLEGRDETFRFCALAFFASSIRKKMSEFVDALEKARAAAPQMADEEATARIEDAVHEYAGCEKCGGKGAAMLYLGTFYCVGFLPFFGAYHWKPTRRYLCSRHAVRQCLLLTFTTALFGYWGFPGVFVAPIRVWKNLSSLKKAFPATSAALLAFGFLVGLAPLVLVAILIVSVIH